MKRLMSILFALSLFFNQASSMQERMQEEGSLFVNEEQKESVMSCDGYKFVEFIKNAQNGMLDPEVISMVRACGYRYAHVPYLLVWSSHLYDRLTSSTVYCSETQDLQDILKLILIIDIRAQVDAACINAMVSTFKQSVDSKFIAEKTQHASAAAAYLKSKLIELWSATLQNEQIAMPAYKIVLDQIKRLSTGWQEENLMSPVWVCCVKKQSGMRLNNWAAGWSGEKFGNWWDPEEKLLNYCGRCKYSELRETKTAEVFSALQVHGNWCDYFGDLIKLNDLIEYDSDGGF